MAEVELAALLEAVFVPVVVVATAPDVPPLVPPVDELLVAVVVPDVPPLDPLAVAVAGTWLAGVTTQVAVAVLLMSSPRP